MLSNGQLLAVMPHLPGLRGASLLPFLQAAMDEFGIVTQARMAAFLAQLAHESGELRYFTELADGAAYEGRKDLGNTEPGDGPRYKGRGPIQLTGRGNYRIAGGALGVELEARPELAANPDVAFRIAGWYWRGHGCNELADAGDFEAITRRINGGLSGQMHRLMYWSRAKAALGLT